MYKNINSLDEFQMASASDDAALFYFSHAQCNVCKVLKPKIEELIQQKFPKIKLFYCNTIESPEIAAQNRVFAVPTIIVFLGGKEFMRKSRNLGIGELSNELERPYSLMFNE